MVLEVVPDSGLRSGEPAVGASSPEALIEEARRVRRRRLWRTCGVLGIVVLLGVGAGLAVALGGSGEGGSKGSAEHGRPSEGLVAVPQTAPVGAGIVGRGATAIDFSNVEHGWIATGGGLSPQGVMINPTIVVTTDGGTSWTRTRVPNVASRTVNPAVYRSFGGLVGIHFTDPDRGWYFQAGLGWQTNNRGATWSTMHVPDGGALVALTSSGGDVWALVDVCSVGVVSCPQAAGRAVLYHAVDADRLSWTRVGAPLPLGTAGFATLYPIADRGVAIALGYGTITRRLGRSPGRNEPEGAGCAPVGALADGELAGICGAGGGGNASLSQISVSDDHGALWKPVLGGPPSSQFVGELSTNGEDAVFYVTGGQTLWRTSTSDVGWTAVLRVPSNSTDEIAPVYVRGAFGLALVSMGLDANWFESHDGGVTWQAISMP
jgi:hypothetical protein